MQSKIRKCWNREDYSPKQIVLSSRTKSKEEFEKNKRKNKTAPSTEIGSFPDPESGASVESEYDGNEHVSNPCHIKWDKEFADDMTMDKKK